MADAKLTLEERRRINTIADRVARSLWPLAKASREQNAGLIADALLSEAAAGTARGLELAAQDCEAAAALMQTETIALALRAQAVAIRLLTPKATP